MTFALRTAAAKENVDMLAKYEVQNGPALKALQESGTELRTFSKEIIDTLKGHADDLYQEYTQQSEFFAQVYPQWSEFRDSIRFWNQQGEYQTYRIAYGDL